MSLLFIAQDLQMRLMTFLLTALLLSGCVPFVPFI